MAVSAVLTAVASALRADQFKLEQVSLNAANASTPGYRRGVVTAVSFNAVMGAEEAQSASSTSTLPMAAPLLQRSTDMTPSTLQATGRPLDVAIEGKGMLLLTDGTRSWLTRAGSLQVNEQGELVGHRGLRVVGDGDLSPGSLQDLSIDASGQLRKGVQLMGRLRVVNVAEPRALSTVDGLLFDAPEEDVVDVPVDQRAVRAGFLETSNVNGLNDMLGVMETVRHYESLIRLAQGYDEVVGKAIQKLGEL